MSNKNFSKKKSSHKLISSIAKKKSQFVVTDKRNEISIKCLTFNQTNQKIKKVREGLKVTYSNFKNIFFFSLEFLKLRMCDEAWFWQFSVTRSFSHVNASIHFFRNKKKLILFSSLICFDRNRFVNNKSWVPCLKMREKGDLFK